MGVSRQELLVFLACPCPAEAELGFLQESQRFAEPSEGFPEESGTLELHTWISVLLYPPGKFSSLPLFMALALASHAEFSLLINLWEYLISGDGFCLLKNISLFFPSKGGHAGAHLCFPRASTGSFSTLHPGKTGKSGCETAGKQLGRGWNRRGFKFHSNPNLSGILGFKENSWFCLRGKIRLPRLACPGAVLGCACLQN